MEMNTLVLSPHNCDLVFNSRVQMAFHGTQGGRLDQCSIIFFGKMKRNKYFYDEFPYVFAYRVKAVIKGKFDVIGWQAALVAESFNIDTCAGCKG